MAPAALAPCGRAFIIATGRAFHHLGQATRKGTSMAKEKGKRGAKTAFIREGWQRFPDLMPKDLAEKLNAEATERGLNIGPIRGQDVSLVKSAAKKAAAGGEAAARGGTAPRSGRKRRRRAAGRGGGLSRTAGGSAGGQAQGLPRQLGAGGAQARVDTPAGTTGGGQDPPPPRPRAP